MSQTVKFGKVRLSRYSASRVYAWEFNSKSTVFRPHQGRDATRRSGVARVDKSQ